MRRTLGGKEEVAMGEEGKDGDRTRVVLKFIGGEHGLKFKNRKGDSFHPDARPGAVRGILSFWPCGTLPINTFYFSICASYDQAYTLSTALSGHHFHDLMEIHTLKNISYSSDLSSSQTSLFLKPLF